MSTAISSDLASIGLAFDKWQDAVESAIATNRLAVTGEVRGGQLIQYADPSGAQLNILAVEPFATFAGFDAVTRTYAHITPLNDVVALADIVDPRGGAIASATINLAQEPLLVDGLTDITIRKQHAGQCSWALFGLGGGGASLTRTALRVRRCRRSLVVEHQLPKLRVRVRFSSPALRQTGVKRGSYTGYRVDPWPTGTWGAPLPSPAWCTSARRPPRGTVREGRGERPPA